MRTLWITLAALLALVGIGALVVASGRIDVSATGARAGPVEWLLERTRERSVATRTAGIPVPPLEDPVRIAAGARLYGELCAACHGAPGRERSAVGRGLNPPPPDLTAGIAAGEAAGAFWVTSHGIRMTGMPAFGPSLSREEIWSLVAFLVAMETLTEEEYEALAGAPTP